MNETTYITTVLEAPNCTGSLNTDNTVYAMPNCTGMLGGGVYGDAGSYFKINGSDEAEGLLISSVSTFN